MSNFTMRYLIVGEHGSGTTWVFNVVRHAVSRGDKKPTTGWLEAMPPPGLRYSLQSGCWVLKSHGFPDMRSFVFDTRATVIRVCRPLHECILSVHRRTKFPMGRCRDIVQTDTDNLSSVLVGSRFNYHEDKIGTGEGVERVLERAGIPSGVRIRKEITDLFCKENVRQMAAEMKEGDPDIVKDEIGVIYNARTLIQKNHVS